MNATFLYFRHLCIFTFNFVFNFIFLASFSNENQTEELKKLQETGHGFYPRLLSLMTSLSDLVHVNSRALHTNNRENEITYSNSVRDFSCQAVSLQDLCDIVSDLSANNTESKY